MLFPQLYRQRLPMKQKIRHFPQLQHKRTARLKQNPAQQRLLRQLTLKQRFPPEKYLHSEQNSLRVQCLRPTRFFLPVRGFQLIRCFLPGQNLQSVQGCSLVQRHQWMRDLQKQRFRHLSESELPHLFPESGVLPLFPKQLLLKLFPLHCHQPPLLIQVPLQRQEVSEFLSQPERV